VLLESKAKIKTWNNASFHFVSSVCGHRRNFVSVCHLAANDILRSSTVVCGSHADIGAFPFRSIDNSDKDIGRKSKHSGAGGDANEFLIGVLRRARDCFESKWT
jgi:hypothetical protein